MLLAHPHRGQKLMNVLFHAESPTLGGRAFRGTVFSKQHKGTLYRRIQPGGRGSVIRTEAFGGRVNVIAQRANECACQAMDFRGKSGREFRSTLTQQLI